MTTDRIATRAADRILADLVERGGGTYEHGTMLPFEPTTGYAVGLGGIHMPASEFTAERVLFFGSRVAGEYEAAYFGTWLDDGEVYIDAVRYFGLDNDQAAIRCAVEHGQKALYDFGTQRVVSAMQVEFDS